MQCWAAGPCVSFSNSAEQRASKHLDFWIGRGYHSCPQQHSGREHNDWKHAKTFRILDRSFDGLDHDKVIKVITKNVIAADITTLIASVLTMMTGVRVHSGVLRKWEYSVDISYDEELQIMSSFINQPTYYVQISIRFQSSTLRVVASLIRDEQYHTLISG